MALATRYDVSTHVDSSGVDARLPAMCGSATFATLVSSTSMNVASITTPAITQGLMAGFSGTAMSKTCGCIQSVSLAYARGYSVIGLLGNDCRVHVHTRTQDIVAARNRV